MSDSASLPSMLMVEAAMRVELAAAELGVADAHQRIMRSWVTGLPFDHGEVAVEVAASVDLRRTTWRASGSTSAMIEPMLDFFDLVGADADRQSRLTDFGQRVRPERLGHWMQIRDEHVDAGWFAPVELDLSEALTETPASRQRDGFAAWCDEHDIEEVSGFERSLGPADYAGIWFPLPGADVAAQVASFEELMDDLDIGRLPDVQRMLLVADDRATLIGSIWLIAEGVARVSIGVIEPEPSVFIALSMAVGADSDDRLARVQGAFDADAPSIAEAVVYDGMADVEVGWVLDIDQ